MRSFFVIFSLLALISCMAFATSIKPNQLQPITNAQLASNDLFLVYDSSAGITKKLTLTEMDSRYLFDLFSQTGDGLVPAPLTLANKFLRDDGTWQTVATSVSWGTILGTLSAQTDLQNALNAKVATPGTSTDNAVATWNGTSGAALKNSTVTITSGRLVVPVGSVATPSLAVGDDSGTGFFQPNQYVLGYAVLGTKYFEFENNPSIKMFGNNAQLIGTQTLQLKAGSGQTVQSFVGNTQVNLFYAEGQLLNGIFAAASDGIYDIGTDFAGNPTGNRFRSIFMKEKIVQGATRVQHTGSVQTTNATPTDSFSLGLAANTSYMLYAKCIARNGTTDRAHYNVAALVYRDAGSAAIEGSVASVVPAIESGGASSWDASITVSGNNAHVTVTGASSTTINWECSVDYDSTI